MPVALLIGMAACATSHSISSCQAASTANARPAGAGSSTTGGSTTFRAVVSPSSLKQSTAFGPILDRIEEQVAKENVSDAAYGDLEKILEKEPTNYRAHLLLGNCYELLGLREQATQEYELATKYGPNSPTAVVELIKMQIRSGKVQSAMALLESATRKFPNDPDIMFWVGNYLFTQKRWNEAENAYLMALDKNKKILGLSSALGEIRLAQGHYGRAFVLAEDDLAIKKDFPLAHRVRGIALANTGRYQRAVPSLKVAFKYNPLADNVALLYAKSCIWSGLFSEALEPALLNLALNSSLETAALPEKELVITTVRKLPDKEVSEVTARVTKRLGMHNSAAFHFALGDAFDTAGRWQLATEQFRQGLVLDPSFGRGWYRLGKELELHTKNYDEALSYYQKASALEPSDAQISYHVNRLHDRLSSRPGDWAWKLKDLIRKPGQ